MRGTWERLLSFVRLGAPRAFAFVVMRELAADAGLVMLVDTVAPRQTQVCFHWFGLHSFMVPASWVVASGQIPQALLWLR